MKVKINTKGGYFSVLNSKQLNSLLSRQENLILTSYEHKRVLDNIIIYSNELSGDRLDGWARHKYYIAIDKNTKQLLGALHISHGWKVHNIDVWIDGLSSTIAYQKVNTFWDFVRLVKEVE